MKINNFFIPEQIQKKEKLNRKVKTSFSEYIENTTEEIEEVSSLEQIASINFNKVTERNAYEEKKAYNFSKKAIEQLEELRDNIASGVISLNELEHVKEAIYNIEKKFLNQKLQVIIDEIELRVEVEIAKIEQSLKSL